MQGCLGADEMVGDIFLQEYGYYYNTSSDTDDGFEAIDSILFYTDNFLESKTKAVKKMRSSEKVYKRLRDLVIRQKDAPALEKLAEYRREEDVQLILDLFDPDYNSYHIYRSIESFPYPSFLPFLEKRVKESYDKKHFYTEWGPMYSACYQYEKQAIPLFMESIRNVTKGPIRKYHLEYIFYAVSQELNPAYAEVYWELWENDKKLIDLDILKFLLTLDKERAYRLTTSFFDLESTVQDSAISIEVDSFSTEKPMEFNLLQLIKVNDQILYYQIIERELEKTKYLSMISTMTLLNKESQFKDALFERLYHEDNIYYFIVFTQGWLDYREDQMNQELIDFLKTTDSFDEDWKKAKIEKLLAEYNLSLE